MAELADALDLGTVLPLKFAGGGGVHGTGRTLANSSGKSQSQSGYYRMNDEGKGQSNKRANQDRKLPPEEYKWTAEQHQFR
jgi:hypothetical protein